MSEQEPLIKLQPGGTAPVLSYNVPEPSAYSGRNIIELAIAPSWFKQKGRVFKKDERSEILEMARSQPVGMIEVLLKDPRYRDQMLQLVHPTSTRETMTLPRESTRQPAAMMSTTLSSPEGLQNEEHLKVVAMNLSEGRLPVRVLGMSRNMRTVFVTPSNGVVPRLLLIETYRLSSFLGAYGAGRTIKTFSLLPGEKTTLSIKTYTKREETKTKSSSIFDSYSETTADDFEDSVTNEQSNSESMNEANSWNVSASAEASWGFGSASISGGASGSTNSTRDNFAKNVSNASQKHAASASANRDIKVDETSQVTQESGEEASVIREIQNINVGRTLNFVFRQMNQEFISLLHLVDVRLAYTNSVGPCHCTNAPQRVYRECNVSDMDELLADVVMDDKAQEAKRLILAELKYIMDFQNRTTSIVEEAEVKDEHDNIMYKYLRVKRDLRSTYSDASNEAITVPGIIVAANKFTLRTDGIIVEALLGQGEALDGYSKGLQVEAVREKNLQNRERETRLQKDALARKLVEEHDAEGAKLFEQVFEEESRSAGA